MFFKYSRQSSSVFSFFGSNQLGRIPVRAREKGGREGSALGRARRMRDSEGG